MDTYTEAHLFVAAIRILQYQKNLPPSLEDVCGMLGISVESGHATSRFLKKNGIVETLEDPYSLKLLVKNHLELENIPRRQTEKDLFAQELERFQKEKKSKEKKVEEIRAEMEKKQRDKLSEIEAKFKRQMEEFKKKS